MDEQYISRDRTYKQCVELPVFRCRIGAHTLGVQVSNAKSENHLTLYLLTGNGRCVRVDMTVGNNDIFVGKLILRAHDFTLSNTIIRWVDVDAYGCPSDFKAEEQPSGHSGTLTVQDFVDLIISQGYHKYRFMFNDGGAIGCRHWVWTVMMQFRQKGYLKNTVDFSQGRPSLWTLVHSRWDVRYGASPAALTPGLFWTREPAVVDSDSVKENLSTAVSGALIVLANALEAREFGITRSIMALGMSSRHQKATTMRQLRRVALEDGRKGSVARDLHAADTTWIRTLDASLERRYGTA